MVEGRNCAVDARMELPEEGGKDRETRKRSLEAGPLWVVTKRQNKKFLHNCECYC